MKKRSIHIMKKLSTNIMKKLSTLILVISFLAQSTSCFAQGFSDDQMQRIRTYFYNAGYTYLQAGHLSCNVQKVNVIFPENDNSYFWVSLQYKDFLDQVFTCFYQLSWNGAKDLFIRLWKDYQKNHPSDSRDEDQMEQQLTQLFQTSLEKLTCPQLTPGFLILDYLGS